MTPFEMTWQAPEFIHRERDVSWYWISIIIAAAIIAFAVWQRDFLFGLFIIVAEILAIVWASRTPRMINFSLSDHDFLIDTMKHYRISEFESFSMNIDNEEIFSELILHPKGKLRSIVIASIPTVSTDEARKNLRTLMKRSSIRANLY